MSEHELAAQMRDIYLNISMHYEPGGSNHQTSRRRMEMTLKLTARFRIVAPTVIQHLYKLSRARALIHLNRLVEQGFLQQVDTQRSLDGRVYTLTHAGARFAEELLEIAVPFRSTANPAHQFNANSVMHDLMMMHTLHMTNGNGAPLWDGYLTELEFKRVYSSHTIRNVDALVRSRGELIALELENCHKTYQTHQTNLKKYAEALRQGLYKKVFFISASERVLADTKRQHLFALEQMSARKTQKSQTL